MSTTLLATGLVCVIAAIVGGGLKAYGTEIPILSSYIRQVLLGTFGAGLLLVSYIDPLSLYNDDCEDQPKLLLNEVCAEGPECDGLKDFVEIYNPSDSVVRLSCYTIVNKANLRAPLEGELHPKEVRAWNHDFLKFRLSVSLGDEVKLLRARPGGGELIDDSRPIDSLNAYSQRIPNGESWVILTSEVVVANGNVGTFNGSNSPIR